MRDLDQNLENFNKNRIEFGAIYPSANFNLSFLEESQHIGHTKYVETKAGFNLFGTYGTANYFSESSINVIGLDNDDIYHKINII